MEKKVEMLLLGELNIISFKLRSPVAREREREMKETGKKGWVKRERVGRERDTPPRLIKYW